MLDVHAGGLGEHLALPQIATQHANFIRGAKSASQQTVGMQLLDPLAIKDIRLAAGDILNVARIDQLDFEPVTFQHFKQRDPVNTGRFHSHAGNATLLEPSGKGFKVSSESAK